MFDRMLLYPWNPLSKQIRYPIKYVTAVNGMSYMINHTQVDKQKYAKILIKSSQTCSSILKTFLTIANIDLHSHKNIYMVCICAPYL